MFMLKPILDSLYRTFNCEDNDSKDEIQREVRKAYYELCGATSWEHLRDSILFAYNEGVDGMWLPADLIDVDCVSDGEHLWSQTSMSGALNYRCAAKLWYIAEHNRTPLVAGKGIKISDGSKTFTGAPEITAAMTGEYIRIGSQSGAYKLASATTLETPYYGAKQISGTFSVRPIGTKRIKLLTEDAQTDATPATIFFHRFPAQLYSDDQPVMLPRSDILELAVKEKMFDITLQTDLKNSVQKDLYGSKGRYEGKLQKAIAENPDFVPPVTPLNRTGQPAGWGARR